MYGSNFPPSFWQLQNQMDINRKISSTIILFTEAGKKNSSPNSALVCSVVTAMKLGTKRVLVSLIAGVERVRATQNRMSRDKRMKNTVSPWAQEAAWKSGVPSVLPFSWMLVPRDAATSPKSRWIDSGLLSSESHLFSFENRLMW